ncbi:hypothetical protein ACFFRL_03110 [Agromyces hippuratus]|uniref:hypothetical protein n=1 Tax=Agromyces hippuratus TaxID=286438 RepID=UPI0035E5FF07
MQGGSPKVAEATGRSAGGGLASEGNVEVHDNDSHDRLLSSPDAPERVLRETAASAA